MEKECDETLLDKNLVRADTFNLMEYRYLLPFIYIGNSDIGKLKADQHHLRRK